MELELKKEKDSRHISFSEYSTYLTCPHKWYLNYILKFPGEVSEELIFGSAVHNTIENLLTNEHIKRLYTINKVDTIRNIFKGFLKDELEKVKDENFLQSFANKKLASIFLFQATTVISQLDFNIKFKDYEVVDVEVQLDGEIVHETDDFKITYKGFVDLVLKHKTTGRYLILDWKSSKKAWDITKKMKDNPDFFAQLCLYKKFYSSIKNIDFDLIDTKFYNLPREEANKQSTYDGILRKEYVENFFEKFKNTAIEIYLKSKEPNNLSKAKNLRKNNFCFRCPYNKVEMCNDIDEYQIVAPIP